MTQLTLNLPDELASRLAPYEEQLPQIIEYGLKHVASPSTADLADLRDVLERLAGLPSPEEVLQMQASPELQERIHNLLEKNRTEGLSPDEERELAQIELIEHIVRLAKGRAHAKLRAG